VGVTLLLAGAIPELPIDLGCRRLSKCWLPVSITEHVFETSTLKIGTETSASLSLVVNLSCHEIFYEHCGKVTEDISKKKYDCAERETFHEEKHIWRKLKALH